MISAKEANIISLVNDCFGDYLDSIEKYIIKAAKAGECYVSIDLVSFGVDTATRDGKKIANGIADYLSNAGYNVSISSGYNRASLIIDLSATKYLKEGSK